MAHALRSEGQIETARFVEYIDNSDCLNVNSITGGQKKRKNNRYPYRTSNDDRLVVILSIDLSIVQLSFTVVTERFFSLSERVGG